MATPQLSPGVISQEVDLTLGRVDNVVSNVGALAGPFPTGPINEPIVIKTMAILTTLACFNPNAATAVIISTVIKAITVTLGMALVAENPARKYVANPKAAVAAEATLANKNNQPATNPSRAFKYRLAYSYAPPLTGWLTDN